MRAGELNRRIALEAAQEGQDGTGDVKRTWNSVATVWASVEALDGRERSTAQELFGEAEYRITIRYRDDVRPKWRAVEPSTGRIYQVEAVVPDERRAAAVLLCKEEHA